MIIALTGGIATGKSTVSSILAELGAFIIDADKINHDVLKMEEVKSELKKYFGDIIVKGSEIDRKSLAKVVFNDENKRKILENTTHPRVKKEISRKIKDSENKSRIIVVEVPLLFESNMQNMMDRVWVISADNNVQLKRLQERDLINKEEALKRINTQMPLEKKEKLADRVIDNSGSFEDLKIKVQNHWRDIKNEN